jgi:hypothetical protein
MTATTSHTETDHALEGEDPDIAADDPCANPAPETEPEEIIEYGVNSLYPGVRVSIERVGAGLGAEWLKTNEDDRTIKKGHVELLTRAILTQRWELNGATVCFDVDGQRIDGRHRLRAIIAATQAAREAGVEFNGVPMIVVRGLSKTAQATIDTGVSRRAADVLALNGIPDAALASAIAKLIWRWERGEIGPSQLVRPRALNSEVLDVVLAHPELAGIVRKAHTLSKNGNMKGKLTPAVAGFILWLLHDRMPTEADEFTKRMWLGLELREKDPCYVVRKRLDDGAGKEKVDTYTKLCWLILAWNSWQSGQPLEPRHLQLRNGGRLILEPHYGRPAGKLPAADDDAGSPSQLPLSIPFTPPVTAGQQ